MYPILTSRSHNSTFEKETKLSIRFSYLQQKKEKNKNHFKLISHRKILRIGSNPRTDIRKEIHSPFLTMQRIILSILEAAQSHRSPAPFSRQIRPRFAFVSLYYGYTLLRLIAHDHLKRVSLSLSLPPQGKCGCALKSRTRRLSGRRNTELHGPFIPGPCQPLYSSLRDYCWIPIPSPCKVSPRKGKIIVRTRREIRVPRLISKEEERVSSNDSCNVVYPSCCLSKI